MQMGGQLHALVALPRVKGPRYKLNGGGEWVPKSVWTLSEEKKIIAPGENQARIPRSFILQPSYYND
jgi:hypothetical protein